MRYLAVLGRQPELSLAEIKALYNVEPIAFIPASNEPRHPLPATAVFDFAKDAPSPDLSRLGGTIKLARELEGSPIDYLRSLPEGKIVLGISDYSVQARGAFARETAMKFKKKLARSTHRNVRVVNPSDYCPYIPSATAHHNHLSEKPTHVELIRFADRLGDEDDWFVSLGTQNITAYARRDRARPARDAKVGMLPPKLAQILINFCGPLPKGARLLDPFCGTGVLLQEATLMGYIPYGTDLSERMANYTRKNLSWLGKGESFVVEVADATTATWQPPIDAVACETYLGPPMSTPPSDIKLKESKHECHKIILGFLKNLAPQIKSNTPVVLATPAWLRENGQYSSLNILDEIKNMGYNVIKYNNTGKAPLLYHREGQVVAREIIVLRKK